MLHIINTRCSLHTTLGFITTLESLLTDRVVARKDNFPDNRIFI